MIHYFLEDMEDEYGNILNVIGLDCNDPIYDIMHEKFLIIHHSHKTGKILYHIPNDENFETILTDKNSCKISTKDEFALVFTLMRKR